MHPIHWMHPIFLSLMLGRARAAGGARCLRHRGRDSDPDTEASGPYGITSLAATSPTTWRLRADTLSMVSSGVWW